MWGAWRLITPGRAYRPPFAADDPAGAELRALAERDLAAGRTVRDWSDEERERWLGSYHKQRAFSIHYSAIRRPTPPLAPPRWRDELALTALFTVVAAVSERGPDTWPAAIALLPVWHVLDELEQRARRRSGARLGLARETTPVPVTVSGGAVLLRGDVRRQRPALAPWGPGRAGDVELRPRHPARLGRSRAPLLARRPPALAARLRPAAGTRGRGR